MDWAALREWYLVRVVCTFGSVVIAIGGALAVIGNSTGIEIPPRVWQATLLVGIVLAQFLAYRPVRQQLARTKGATGATGATGQSCPPSPSANVRRYMSQQKLQVPGAIRPRPSHSVANGIVTLRLTLSAWPPHSIQCVVIDPNGQRTNSLISPHTLTFTPLSVVYPDKFEDAKKLESGHYRVLWEVPDMDPLSFLAGKGTRLILGQLAEDHFEIRDGGEIPQ